MKNTLKNTSKGITQRSLLTQTEIKQTSSKKIIWYN